MPCVQRLVPVLSISDPITTPPKPNNCRNIATLPTNDKCWRKWQNMTEGVCSPEGIMKAKSERDETFTYAACSCNTESKGNGFYCQGSCTNEEANEVLCRGDLTCKRHQNGTFFCGCPAGYYVYEFQCKRVEDTCDACKHSCQAASKCLPQSDPKIDDLEYCSDCDEEMGFSGQNGKCKNINECTSHTDTCEPNAVCYDKNPLVGAGLKYLCKCNPGFVNDTFAGTLCNPCQDIDECADKTSCGANSICTNTVGSFKCECKKGFTKNGSNNCVDVDECKDDPCAAQAVCLNTEGSYNCTCKPGFTGHGEKGCSPDPAQCMVCDKASTNCTLAADAMSYICVCKNSFYVRESEIKCIPKTYCKSQTTCAPIPKANCTNRPDGSGYDCHCMEGYTGNGTNCYSTDICTFKQPCLHVSNTDCKSSAADPEKWKCNCKAGTVRQAAETYDDTKPCYGPGYMANNCSSCSKQEVCRDTVSANLKEKDKGMLKECQCKDGYRRDATDKCIGVNECLEVGMNDCDNIRATCIDKDPVIDGKKYICVCNEGFEGDGTLNNCKNINECAHTPSVCKGPHENCTDTSPYYKCECLPGYRRKHERGPCEDHDECNDLSEPATCPPYTVCANTNGSYECNCRTGFKELSRSLDNKSVCESIIQCTVGNVLTKLPACNKDTEICQDVPGSFYCTCKPGYERIGGDCTDINECLKSQAHNCDHQTTVCNNTIGSYNCACLDGYIPSGNSTTECVDRDECASNATNLCNPNSYCINSIGSYQCQCDTDFEPTRTSSQRVPYCERKNVCVQNPLICNMGTCVPTKTAPYFACDCRPGTIKFNNTICIDHKYCDESNEFPCPEQSDCEAAKKCVCKPGYSWKDLSIPYTLEDMKTNRECQPIDWCKTYPVCNGMLCRNTAPGQGECYCDPGFKNVDGKCENIDECVTLSNETVSTCPAHSYCEDTPGSYLCHCDTGYTNDYKNPTSTAQKPVCIDIDECLLNRDNCTKYPNSYCKNNIGGFTCECEKGFKRDQFGDGKYNSTAWNDRLCVDIDECKEDRKIYPCDSVANCTNIPGDYICTCPKGYIGRGKDKCNEIDECTLGTDNCTKPSETCFNLPGSFNCTCSPGYEYKGGKCINIVECNDATICGTKVCVDEIGFVNGNKGYYCVCPIGYYMHKDNVCKDIDECGHLNVPCPTERGNYCNNTVGSFECLCLPGFEKPEICARTPRNCSCVDIDECTVGKKDGSLACAANSNCTNNPGSYRCDCKEDHEGTPYVAPGCKLVDICQKEPCKQENSICIPTSPKTRKCDCKEGYISPGQSPEGDTICRLPPCKNMSVILDKSCACEDKIDKKSNMWRAQCVCVNGTVSVTDAAGQERCVDGDPCKCEKTQYPCNHSPACSDPEKMTCSANAGKPVCECESHFKYNNVTQKCDETNPCETHPCPKDANCVVVKELGVNKTRICYCPLGKKLVKDALQREECQGDPTCGRPCPLHSNCTHQELSDSYLCKCNVGFEDSMGTCIPENACTTWRRNNPGKEKCGPNSRENGDDRIECRCDCLPNYIKKNDVCEDVNECLPESAQPCRSNKTHPECHNTNGSYFCDCGVTDNTYEIRDGICQKKDKCLNKVCGPNSICTSKDGECKCLPGYEKHANGTCVNVDECTARTFDCPQHSKCKDLTPGYTCECVTGYEEKPSTNKWNFTCENIKECNSNPCPNNTQCMDTEGSFYCRCIAPLIRVDDFTCAFNSTIGCTDKCGNNAHCIKTQHLNTATGHVDMATYNCTCDEGYEGNAITGCTDIENCKLVPSPCVEHAHCIEEPGSYRCECDTGYSGNGKEKCTRDNLCVPVSPCPAASTCSEPALNETKPTCKCTVAGFKYDPVTNQCIDINECLPCPNEGCPCPKNANCSNTQGSYTCQCPKGFYYDKDTNTCANTDECKDEKIWSSLCPKEIGTCKDTAGSWYCQCKPEYKNDPTNNQTCISDLKCHTIADTCNTNNSHCVNIYPDFKCECMPGWQNPPNNNKICVDVNECVLERHNCRKPSEQCENTNGSHYCVCSAGYERAIANDNTTKCEPLVKCEQQCGPYSQCLLMRDNKTSTCRCDEGYVETGDNITCAVKPCNANNCPAGSICNVVQNQNTTTFNRTQCECLNGLVMNENLLCIPPTNLCNNKTLCNGLGICKNIESFPYYVCHCSTPSCNNATCGDNSCYGNQTCSVVAGVVTCTCPKYFVPNSNGDCVKELQCNIPHKRDSCSKFAKCVDLEPPGEFKCECYGPQYHGNGTVCFDTDECKNQTLNDCDDYTANCTNTQGSYNCKCIAGYRGSGKKNDCKDIDECIEKIDQCDVKTTTCENTNGSYHCLCKPGYFNETFPYFICKNRDECKEDSKLCKPHTCTDTDGDYKCDCLLGYHHPTPTDNKKCEVTDNCKLNNGGCHTNAICKSVIADRSCTCKDNYEGDGIIKCTMVNQCLNATNRCDNVTTVCQMLSDRPEYRCDCREGYEPPAGQSAYHDCKDKNECLNGDIEYDNLSTDCKNLPGDYILTCKAGYENTHPHPNAHNVTCTNLNECAMDPAFAETIAKMNASATKITTWESLKAIMVPPKVNGSGYSYCYGIAMSGGVFGAAVLPMCRDTQPGVQFASGHNRVEKFKPRNPVGWACDCPNAQPPVLSSGIPICPNTNCNCPKAQGFICNPNKDNKPDANYIACICENPKFQAKVINGITTCVEHECESNGEKPLAEDSKNNLLICENFKWGAVAGYRIVRNNVTGVLADVVDVDECVELKDACCNANNMKTCVGDNCVKCKNTIGSYTCNSQKNDKICAAGHVDKNTCMCSKEQCTNQEAWFYGCAAPHFNVSSDPRLALQDKGQLCSRFVMQQGGDYVQFNSLRELYGRIIMVNPNNDPSLIAACMFDGVGDDLTTTPLFNYWGPCQPAANKDKVKCETGEPDVLSKDYADNNVYCPLRLKHFPPTVFTGMPLGYKAFSQTPQCLQDSFSGAEGFKTDMLYYAYSSGTMSMV